MERTHFESDKFCVFRSGNSWFALPALTVRAVSFRPNIVPVPLSDPALVGLCHLRNKFIPVLSWQALWGDQIDGPSLESQMLALNELQTDWALLVDQVAGLESLETSFSADSADDDKWSAASLGWATFQDQAVRVLNPCRLYLLAENILESFWNTALAAPAPTGGTEPALLAEMEQN